MARLHGRTGRLYADFTSGGAAAAAPVASLSNWSVSFTSPKVNVTSLGDQNQQYVAGLPDSSGSFSGFYDEGAASAYAASIDTSANSARSFYLYPTTNSTSVYWFGTAYFDASYSAGVDGAIELTGDWSAASNVIAVGVT